MHYKTIVLELLKQKPKMYDKLRKRRMLLEALEFFARQLKMSHQVWLARHFQTRPDSDQSQISAEALEMALEELEDFLYSETPFEESD